MNEGEEGGYGYRWPVKAMRELRLRRPPGCIFVKTTYSKDGTRILNTMRVLATSGKNTSLK